MKKETMKERAIRIERLWQDRHNKRILKKAGELNKIMSRASHIENKDNTYKCTFKDGQVFRFTWLPESRFENNKIIPVLEGVRYEN